MGNLRPIGSEKLQGMDKINRMIEISRYKENTPSSINESRSTEYSIVLADGNKYQIIKERAGYIIKKAINESENDYIAPMKNRHYYPSYSQAFKRMNLMAKEMNTLFENEQGTSLYNESKKYILKRKSTNEEMGMGEMELDEQEVSATTPAPAPAPAAAVGVLPFSWLTGVEERSPSQSSGPHRFPTAETLLPTRLLQLASRHAHLWPWCRQRPQVHQCHDGRQSGSCRRSVQQGFSEAEVWLHSQV